MIINIRSPDTAIKTGDLLHSLFRREIEYRSNVFQLIQIVGTPD